MPIQILPPLLANQIAAGEVVERPASVVKELVENSLDAGANKIQIDIEQSGAGLIRIRDNGIGIPKEELKLALMRHATSKITSLDDLENILSLGFRGEALASISSVSRLTLTSRTAEQSEAWQAYAQGQEMEATIIPASHPIGTTVEVANLFFNTPARRKFLRSDKTEFAHIDDVIKRIALAKPTTHFILTHNGKLIHQYKPAYDTNTQLKRLTAICGNGFAEYALRIDWQYDDMHLSGWIATPDFYRSQNDFNFSYVNGRMMKDKVILHALRQAYAPYLSTEQYPAFVLFLDMDPTLVDVNVHPTKHEVRFHQARLVHDFIFQGITNALSQNVDTSPLSLPTQSEGEPSYSATQVAETCASYIAKGTEQTIPSINRAAAGKNIFQSSRESTSQQTSKTDRIAYKQYTQLIQTSEPPKPTLLTPQVKDVEHSFSTQNAAQHLKALTLLPQGLVCLQQHDKLYFLSALTLQKAAITQQLQDTNKVHQALLIPISFQLTPEQLTQFQQYQRYFDQAGFTIQQFEKRITITHIPALLRHQNLQQLTMLLLNSNLKEFSDFTKIIAQQITLEPVNTLADVINLLQTIEQSGSSNQNTIVNMCSQIDLTPYLMEQKGNE